MRELNQKAPTAYSYDGHLSLNLVLAELPFSLVCEKHGSTLRPLGSIPPVPAGVPPFVVSVRGDERPRAYCEKVANRLVTSPG